MTYWICQNRPALTQCVPKITICSIKKIHSSSFKRTYIHVNRMTDVKVKVISIKEMETKMKQKANIKFCVKLEKKFAETYELMKKVYGDDCMSRAQLYTWFTRFKNGREDLNDDLRPDRPEVSNRAELMKKSP